MDIKKQVQEFYNQVGWQQVAEGVYQNAAYEDLRPVSSEYIRRCHLRVLRHLKPAGQFLLDAGSGPIQYPEYLVYSQYYQRRVCVDISILALQEARKRIGEHGLFVVADVANLPFKGGGFDGAVSLHTIHHLPAAEHPQAYAELARVLVEDGAAVVVNGWTNPPLMRWFIKPIAWAKKQRGKIKKKAKNPPPASSTTERGESETLIPTPSPVELQAQTAATEGGRGRADFEPLSTSKPGGRGEQRSSSSPKWGRTGGEGSDRSPEREVLGQKGTFVSKYNAAWLKQEVGKSLPQGRRLEIWCWRSLSVSFLRTFIHKWLAGRWLLRVVFWLEERFPHILGENGQYPLIVITPRVEQ